MVKPISALVWLFISFKDVFPVKKEMIYICKEMRMNQQLGTFHYNWNDISLWLDHYSLTGAGYGSLDSLQIPHIWGSRPVLWSLDLFICPELTFVFTLSLLGYFAFLHFTKWRTIGPQILIRKLSIFVPSLLSVNHVNVNKKVRNVQILLGQDLKTLCKYLFINNTKRRSVLVSVLFVWRNFRC